MSTTKSSTKPLTPRPNSKSNLPSLGRQSAKKSAATKIGGKPNASILNFFQKVDSPLKEDSIFLSQGSQINGAPSRLRSPTFDLEEDAEDLYGNNHSVGIGRFNEENGPVKRRKISGGSSPSDIASNGKQDTFANDIIGVPVAEQACSPPPPSKISKGKSKKSKRSGPFLSDSDTDDEVGLSLASGNSKAQAMTVTAEKQELEATVAEQPQNMHTLVQTKSIDQNAIAENKPVIPAIDTVEPLERRTSQRRKRVPVGEAQEKWEALQPRSRSSSTPASGDSKGNNTKVHVLPIAPSLNKEETSVDEWSKFDDVDDFPGEIDEFGDGEEFVERKWMEEQARLEADEDGQEYGDWEGLDDIEMTKTSNDEPMTASCPICNATLNGITTDQATRHVNGCLDGNPEPIPEPVVKPIKRDSEEVKYIPPEGSNRFARKAAIARPGQANPFEIGAVGAAPSTAFSKLMSGHAEDAAWASAAAAEHSARGRPAYERTCPFYKIMPGFFICVDAFRYGAVQGCNAYFLSHFHSDHYVGLTSTWCHGPIYCSKVTGNLVKQQLRVDPKWVISLDFEERFEVPGTQGVAVTMIPANHCPGSSLYLFEKVIGRGKTPKIQRVLHCGDFRACPAHIAHPLLMPYIVDSITGKTKQQKIDVCYLDTTYLNPRYAFPSQENVITACADMCVSLKKERAEEGDAWEVVKRERAGTGMNKFVNTAIKAEDDSIAMSIGSTKARGRLLVVCGTYSIGKERICMGIARALDCKIWAPPGKMRICAALEDPELMSRMTDDPKEAQIHMQMLMELRAETLQEYLNSYKPHFSRIVGFRPSGWNYRPPNSR